MIDVKELENFLVNTEQVQLKEEEKHKLKTLWKDSALLDRALTKVKTNLTNRMLTEELSPQFVKWAIYTISYLRGMMK